MKRIATLMLAVMAISLQMTAQDAVTKPRGYFVVTDDSIPLGLQRDVVTMINMPLQKHPQSFNCIETDPVVLRVMRDERLRQEKSIPNDLALSLKAVGADLVIFVSAEKSPKGYAIFAKRVDVETNAGRIDARYPHGGGDIVIDKLEDLGDADMHYIVGTRLVIGLGLVSEDSCRAELEARVRAVGHNREDTRKLIAAEAAYIEAAKRRDRTASFFNPLYKEALGRNVAMLCGEGALAITSGVGFAQACRYSKLAATSQDSDIRLRCLQKKDVGMGIGLGSLAGMLGLYVINGACNVCKWNQINAQHASITLEPYSDASHLGLAFNVRF